MTSISRSPRIPRASGPSLAGPPLLARLRDYVGIEEDELRGAVRRSLLLAAAAGDPTTRSAPRTRAR